MMSFRSRERKDSGAIPRMMGAQRIQSGLVPRDSGTLAA